MIGLENILSDRSHDVHPTIFNGKSLSHVVGGGEMYSALTVTVSLEVPSP